MRYYDYGYPMHSGFDAVLMVLFWVIIVSLIVSAFRWHNKGCRGGYCGRPHDKMFGGSSAIEILKNRYAKGEIDKVEFEQKKKDLME